MGGETVPAYKTIEGESKRVLQYRPGDVHDWAHPEEGEVVADPGFVDPANDDYRLRPDSPAFALGFQPIPVDRIGPYEDELRASWPIREAPGARAPPPPAPVSPEPTPPSMRPGRPGPTSCACRKNSI